MAPAKKKAVKKTAKKAPEVQKPGLLDEPLAEIGKIESELSLDSITLKKQRWEMKVYVKTTLPRSYHRYKMNLQLDEQPYLDRIDDVEKGLDDTLFKDNPAERKQVNEKVKKMRAELDAKRNECEVIEFFATVMELKYKDGETRLVVRVPDDIIEPMNRQKSRLDLYKLTLYPEL